jgi:hypothetical protein
MAHGEAGDLSGHAVGLREVSDPQGTISEDGS